MTTTHGDILLTVIWLILSGGFFLSIVHLRSRIASLAIAVAIIVWFGLTLLAVPQQYLGWPCPSRLPDRMVINAFKILEPVGGKAGAIYLWGMELPDSPDKLLPDAPRAYDIPYDRELHKRLEDQQKGRREGKVGIPILERKKRKKERGKPGTQDGIWENERLRFRILNPVDALPKKNT